MVATSRNKHRLIVETVTIAASGTTSEAVNLDMYDLVAIFMPAAWTAADITFTASASENGTFGAVSNLDAPGSVYTLTAPSVDERVTITPAQFAGVPFLKLVSSIAQDSARTIQLILRHID